jgi:hypothetical protein
VNRVSAELGGERVHVLQWQGDPARYIAAALGIGYLPSMQLSSGRRATVMLGAIDVRGVRGRQGINLLLASALTEWRIRLRAIGQSSSWKALEVAHEQSISVPASVQSRVSKGLAVEVYGLNALLPVGQVVGVHRTTRADRVDQVLRQLLGQDVQVNVLRLDPDEGRIFVSERLPAARQLPLL